MIQNNSILRSDASQKREKDTRTHEHFSDFIILERLSDRCQCGSGTDEGREKGRNDQPGMSEIEADKDHENHDYREHRRKLRDELERQRTIRETDFLRLGRLGKTEQGQRDHHQENRDRRQKHLLKECLRDDGEQDDDILEKRSRARRKIGEIKILLPVLLPVRTAQKQDNGRE